MLDAIRANVLLASRGHARVLAKPIMWPSDSHVNTGKRSNEKKTPKSTTAKPPSRTMGCTVGA